MNEYERPKIKVLEWNMVAVWKWNSEIENCTICQCLLNEMCPNCNNSTEN